MNKYFIKWTLTHWAPHPLGEAQPGVHFCSQCQKMGSGSSLSPHLAELQMLFIFIPVSSPLTKVTEFLGSIKIMCHRVPWVMCMLLRKEFPFVCLIGCLETSNIYISVSACLPLFLCCQMPLAWLSFILPGACWLYLPLHFIFCHSQHFLESSGMLLSSTQSTECWE